MKKSLLYLYILLFQHYGSTNSYMCADLISFTCQSSGDVTIYLKNATALLDPNKTADGNFTILANHTEYVKVFEGMVTKVSITTPAEKTCFIICSSVQNTVNDSFYRQYPPVSLQYNDDGVCNLLLFHSLPVQQNEVGDVEMRIREDNLESSPEISNAYTGDTAYMFLKYTGHTNYVLQPIDCTAYSGSIVETANASLPLWNISTCNESLTTYFSAFKRHNNTTVSAKMTIFMFTGNEDVTFLCKVRICSSCTPGDNCQYLMSKRKRLVSRSATKTVRVKDRPSERNSNPGTILNLWTLLTSFSMILITSIYV